MQLLEWIHSIIMFSIRVELAVYQTSLQQKMQMAKLALLPA